MTTSREKISNGELQTLKDQLTDELSVAFGDEVVDPFIETALYVFTGDAYETADMTWFLDWQNGRWHVSLQSTTYDYRDGKFEEIGRVISNSYTSNSDS